MAQEKENEPIREEEDVELHRKLEKVKVKRS